MQLRAEFDQALVGVLTAKAVSIELATIVMGGGIAKSLTEHRRSYQLFLEQNIRIVPTLTSVELGDFSGAAGGVVSALHAVYLDLGVQPPSLAALPESNALSPESIHDIGRIVSPHPEGWPKLLTLRMGRINPDPTVHIRPIHTALHAAVGCRTALGQPSSRLSKFL